MNYLPCHSINSSIIEEGGKSQLSDRLKPATVLNLLIRCHKRSLLIISLFFNDKVTLGVEPRVEPLQKNPPENPLVLAVHGVLDRVFFWTKLALKLPW